MGISLFLIIGWFEDFFNTFNFFNKNIPQNIPKSSQNPSHITRMNSQIQDISSGQVQVLRNIHSKVTLLSFWASWCGPCHVELPTLAVLHNIFKDQGLNIIAINLDDEDISQKELVDIWEEMHLPFGFFSDVQRQTSQAFQVQSLPAHFILNQQGEIVVTAYGANDWSHPKNLQIFKDLIKSQQTL